MEFVLQKWEQLYYMNKVFCIGMFKTGTTSIRKAFEILGYKTISYWGINNDAWCVDKKSWDLKQIREKANQHEAFKDFPWLFLYRELDNWFPNSKFILTIRDAEKVAVSDLNHWKRFNITNDQWKIDEQERHIPLKQRFINRYDRHNKDVLDYFYGKDNLLVMNLENGDGWELLCNFLNKSIPDLPFPWENKNTNYN